MQLHRTPLARTATLSLATPLAHRTSRPHCRVLCSSSPTGNGPSCSERPQPPAVLGSSGRRQLLASAASLGFCTFLQLPSGPASAVPLGPLGPVQRVGGDKRTGLSAEEVAEVLRRDLAVGQYFVTGDLTREIFADDCRFVDPTNDVTGLSKYLTALGVLFDPAFSKVELLSIRVTGPRTVEADWRLGGYLVFPWNPRVEPFEGHTVYTLNGDGLVSEQRQTWSISGATALIESFTPTFEPKRQLF